MQCRNLHAMGESAKFCTICGEPASVIAWSTPPLAPSSPPPLVEANVDPLALWMFIGSIVAAWNPVFWVGTLIGTVIALRRTSVPGVRGRRLAIAALVIHVIYFLIFLTAVVFILLFIIHATAQGRLA